MSRIELEDSSILYHFMKGPASKKDTVIFLHGVGLDHTEWNFLLPFMSDFKLLTYDLRWHGESSGTFYSDDQQNWQALMDDLLAIIKQEKIENYHLVSHGIGAQLAVELITQNILDPITVTVISTPFYYPKSVAEKGMKYREHRIKGMTGRELGVWMVPQILENEDPIKHETILRAFEKVKIDLYMDIFRLHANAVYLEKLTKIFMPTLLLNGELDVNYPPELTNLSMKYLPNALIKNISSASNMVHVDQPEETARHIKQFITENASTRKRLQKHSTELPYLNLLYEELENSKSKLNVRVDFLTLFKMSINDSEITGKWNQRKAKELVAYLAFYGKCTRENISAALWPNANKEKAQNSLRVTIHHVRTLLADAGYNELIFSNKTYIWLNEEVNLKCDVHEAIDGVHEIPPIHLMFSDMPVEWVMDIQYELERDMGSVFPSY